MQKKLIIAAAVLLGFAAKANAQVDIQLYYDFGKDRQYASTTIEMFKADKWGDTFFFIDHYFATSDQRKNAGVGSSVNGTYFEVERGINFWQESALKGLSGYIEYDGSSWGAGIWCFGAKYFLHSEDYKNTFSLALMYDLHYGLGEADVPVKFTGVWGMEDLFGLSGLAFKGFIDIWGNNSTFIVDGGIKDTKMTILAEPQIWYKVGQFFGMENLNVGTEIELSYNFAGHKGIMCNPCLGVKWVF